MASINTNTQETSSDPTAQTSAPDDDVGTKRKRRQVGIGTIVAQVNKPKPKNQD